MLKKFLMSELNSYLETKGQHLNNEQRKEVVNSVSTYISEQLPTIFSDTIMSDPDEDTEYDYIWLCDKCDELHEEPTEACESCGHESIRQVSKGDMGM